MEETSKINNPFLTNIKTVTNPFDSYANKTNHTSTNITNPFITKTNNNGNVSSNWNSSFNNLTNSFIGKQTHSAIPGYHNFNPFNISSENNNAYDINNINDDNLSEIKYNDGNQHSKNIGFIDLESAHSPCFRRNENNINNSNNYNNDVYDTITTKLNKDSHSTYNNIISTNLIPETNITKTKQRISNTDTYNLSKVNNDDKINNCNYNDNTPIPGKLKQSILTTPKNQKSELKNFVDKQKKTKLRETTPILNLNDKNIKINDNKRNNNNDSTFKRLFNNSNTCDEYIESNNEKLRLNSDEIYDNMRSYSFSVVEFFIEEIIKKFYNNSNVDVSQRISIEEVVETIARFNLLSFFYSFNENSFAYKNNTDELKELNFNTPLIFLNSNIINDNTPTCSNIYSKNSNLFDYLISNNNNKRACNNRGKLQELNPNSISNLKSLIKSFSLVSKYKSQLILNNENNNSNNSEIYRVVLDSNSNFLLVDEYINDNSNINNKQISKIEMIFVFNIREQLRKIINTQISNNRDNNTNISNNSEKYDTPKKQFNHNNRNNQEKVSLTQLISDEFNSQDKVGFKMLLIKC